VGYTDTRSIGPKEERKMGLSSHMVRASIAVADIARAAEFYERRLGLIPTEGQSDESRIYACGGGTSLHVYQSPTRAGRGTATAATWYVADLDKVVDDLASDGVTFERYDDPVLRGDERGIHALEDGRVAWFRDPDGNTFAIEEGTAS
jgi:catechol 2,3-dioxygenase-like lactoylglutathione lyase family enzyme